MHPEVILCGNDPGVAEAAQSFGVQHLPNVRCSPQGTPLLDDTFAQVHERARGSVLAYVNADIMLMPDFISAVQQVARQHSQFLMLGRRWNLDVEESIDVEQTDWRSHLLTRLQRYGIFSGIGALDYFVFPRPLFDKLPPFAVGRAGWDSWMVGEALKQGYPVVNASQVVTAIHQNHDYNHLPGKRLEAFHGAEAKQNRTFLRGHVAGSSALSTQVLRSPEWPAEAPRISIILADDRKAGGATKRADSFEAAIARLQSQTYSAFEVVSISEPLLTTVEAWNKGLTGAQGEFVLFLDTQAQLLPGALEDWVQAIDRRAGSLEMIFAGWQVVTSTTADSDSESAVVEPWHRLGKLLGGREGLQGLHVWSLPEIWESLHPSSVLFRRDWLARFGSLDERLQSQAAMVDLVLRFSSRGAAAIYLEESVLRCKGFACSSTQKSTGAVESTVQDCRQILDRFFQQSHLPSWSRPLEGHARQTVENWLKRLTTQADDRASKASPQFL